MKYSERTVHKHKYKDHTKETTFNILVSWQSYHHVASLNLCDFLWRHILLLGLITQNWNCNMINLNSKIKKYVHIFLFYLIFFAIYGFPGCCIGCFLGEGKWGRCFLCHLSLPTCHALCHWKHNGIFKCHTTWYPLYFFCAPSPLYTWLLQYQWKEQLVWPLIKLHLLSS